MPFIIGIDFGNQNCLVAVPREHSVDILTNQASTRLTPTMISYSNYRRFCGISAQQVQMENISNVITQIKRLIGLNYDSKERQIIDNLVPFKMVKGNDDFIAIETTFLDKPIKISIEQIIAYLLKGLFEIAKLHKIYPDQCVICVPTCWNELHRLVLLNAAKISKMNPPILLNTTTAVAITYSQYHSEVIDDENDYFVAFIDFGDCCFTSSIVKYHGKSIEVISSCWDSSIGGFGLTNALANYLLPIIKNDYHVNPCQTLRSSTRFWESVEKLKKNLSANQVMHLDFEMNAIDIKPIVKRTDFEGCIAKMVDKISVPIIDSLKIAKIDASQLYAIEIHGGSSRIPLVKNKIKSIFGRDPKQSLNTDECFAQGAGYKAAMIMPQYSLDLKIKDIYFHNITAIYQNIHGQQVQHKLFENYPQIPCNLDFMIEMRESNILHFYTDENIRIGILDIRFRHQSKSFVKIYLHLDQNGILYIQKVTQLKRIAPQRHQTIFNVLINLMDNDNDEGELTEIKVDYRYNSLYSLTQNDLQTYIEIEQEMSKIDVIEEERDQLRNDLEAYIFQFESLLQNNEGLFDPKEYQLYSAFISGVHDWFTENEFERCPSKEYRDRLTQLKEYGDAIIKRKQKWENIGSKCDEFLNRAQKLQERLSEIGVTQRTEKIYEELGEFIQFILQNHSALEKPNLSSDPPVNEMKCEQFLTNVEQLINSLKPKQKHLRQ